MGQTSSCCNPSTHQIQIDNIAFPSNEAFNVEATESAAEEFVEPSEQINATLRKAQSYMLAQKKDEIRIESDQLWQMRTNGEQKGSIIHCRGGVRQESINGKVVLYFPNKQVFKGEIVNNRPTYGVFVFRNNCFYVGDIKNFNAEGQGRFENSDTGYIYEGSWSKSLPHGQGKQIYSNGDRYQGEQSYGGKFGHGTYSFHNGTIYEGSFYNNQSDGSGKLTYSNGNYYDGEWKLGQFHGFGKFVWANGEHYEGEYLEGKRHGQGKYTFKNGSYYQGSWLNGFQSGEGIIKDKFDEIKGIWDNGQLVN